MDDLDSLLADLGKPAQHETDTTTVNMGDLDDLMNDLQDAAAARPAPAAARPAAAAAPRAAADDLDDLLGALEAGPGRAAAAPAPVAARPAPAPAAARLAPAPAAARPAPPAAADDLDALLSDLDSQARPAPAAARPAAAAAPAPARQAAAPPAPKPNSVRTEDLDELLEGLDAPVPSSSASASSRYNPASAGGGSRGGGGGGGGGGGVDDLFNDINSSARSAGGGGRNSTSAPPQHRTDGPARGICGGCNQPVHGEVLQALGKMWHISCFNCGNCQMNLGTQSFFEYEGLPHCDKCYRGLFCPRCAKCDKSITDRIITALGKKWHPDCFTCSTCNQPFPGGSFFEREGYPYCSDHFYSSTVPMCGGCGKAVRGECTNAMNQAWHPDCFVCQYCRKAFTDGNFFESGGKPFCKLHYHSQTGSVCGGCQKAITGRSVNAMGKNWHPEHFVCSFCVNPLGGGNYVEKQGKPYCKECHTNLFE